MTLTALVDDYCPGRGLSGQHGLSLYLRTGSGGLLFDAGQDGMFVDNARALGIDLSSLEAVVLSHGHYDHGGGLGTLYAAIAPARPRLLAGRGHDARRLSRVGDVTRDIGLPEPDGPVLDPLVITGPTEILPGIHVLPAADRTDGSAPAPRFRVGSVGAEAVDPFDDELSLVLVGDDGMVVVTGCAHRGIVNIATAALRVFPDKPLKALVGGFHLADAPDAELARVAKAVAALGPAAVHCSHCTGPRGFAALASVLGARVSWLSCGREVAV